MYSKIMAATRQSQIQSNPSTANTATSVNKEGSPKMKMRQYSNNKKGLKKNVVN